MDAARAVQRIAKAPHTPGVYFWRDAGRRPIYIGKANNLRSRLSSYPRTEVLKTRVMVRAAASITWKETDTEIEALILEAQLIKKFRPRYNVAWRDDKNFYFVEITDDRFPKITISHRPGGIGPFTEGAPLKATLHALRSLFPFCTCTTKHHLRCLNAHIGRCPGYCCLKAEPLREEIREYSRNIRAIRDIFTGRRDTVIRRMVRTDPDTALSLLRVFQHARINARTQGLTGHRDAPHRVEGYDVANIQGQYAVGAMVVFIDGTPDKSHYRLFNIRTGGGDTDMLRELLERRMKHDEWPLPDLAVMDGGIAQLNVALRAFGNHVRVVAVTKNDRHRADKLIGQGIISDKSVAFAVDAEAHRFSIGHYRRRHRKSILKRIQ